MHLWSDWSMCALCCLLQGSSVINKLPPYLTVQMVRFFYKVDTRQKAKILRKVRLRAPHKPNILPVPEVSSNISSSATPNAYHKGLC